MNKTELLNQVSALIDQYTAAVAPATSSPAVASVPPATGKPTRELPPGWQWGQDTVTGQWVPAYIGEPNSIDQKFIDAGGNAGQLAGFKIFVQKSPELADASFADKYAAWVKSQDAAHAEEVAADTPGDYGTAWRGYVANEIDDIDRNFNWLMANKDYGFNWAWNYIAFASPNRLSLRYFSRPLGVTILTCFGYASREKALRDSLHLADDEGNAGALRIAGSTFIISTAGGDRPVSLPFGGLQYNQTPDPTC